MKATYLYNSPTGCHIERQLYKDHMTSAEVDRSIYGMRTLSIINLPGRLPTRMPEHDQSTHHMYRLHAWHEERKWGGGRDTKMVACSRVLLLLGSVWNYTIRKINFTANIYITRNNGPFLVHKILAPDWIVNHKHSGTAHRFAGLCASFYKRYTIYWLPHQGASALAW